MDDEAVGADEFQMIGAGGQGQIQFLKSDTPEAIAERIFAITKRISTDYLRLGREVHRVYWCKVYLRWGYSTFDDCMVDKFEISKERAHRLRLVWTKFMKELLISAERLEGISFTRAYAMTKIINSENADELIERAKTTRTARAFRHHLDLMKGKPKAIECARDTAFSVEETTTEHKAESTPRQVQGEVIDAERPTKVTFNLYPSQREIIDAAIAEVTRNKTGSSLMAPNEALSHVALGFMADRLTKDDRPNAQVRFYLNWFERVYGGKFVWITSDEAAKVLTKAIEDSPSLFPQQGKTTFNPEEDGSDEHHDDSRGSEGEEDEGQADRG